VADGELPPAEQATPEESVAVGVATGGEHDEGVPFGNHPAVDVGQAGGGRRRGVGVIADPGFRGCALVDGSDEPPFGIGRFVRQGDVAGRVESSVAPLTGQEAAGLPGMFGRDVVVDGVNDSPWNCHTPDGKEYSHAIVLAPI
jgi:hypothetical protein